ncbi:Trm112 family protein [Candidatus Pacearchaeota archaeon]|nr:Trm112 family protein [Candidatus Pacearchaeota archaeon]
MINSNLLKILCCPKCKGTLEYNKTRNTLKCSKCKKIYKIKQDMPIMA